MTPDVTDADRLNAREHAQPHAYLGAHQDGDGAIVRAWRPAAASVSVVPEGGKAVPLQQVHPAGVFEGHIPKAELPLAYRFDVDYGDGTQPAEDPYRFLPTIGELDLHLVGEGRHEELWEKLGAHVREIEGVQGTSFSVWAPSAKSVSVVGDFNYWDGRAHPMRSLGSSGIWEVFLPGVGAGAHYKFEILAQDGEIRLKADPLAFEAEVPPKTASVVYDSQHAWADDEWLKSRRESDALEGPISIYEVHLGSWRLNPMEGNRSLTYLELADELAAYARDMGFTHIELMPVMAHPFAGSWGYQVTGYFAPTPRFGSPDDFKAFVDRLHSHGIRVDAVASMLYLDYSREEGEWVPNEHGGREDLDAVAMLKEFNEVAHGREPGIVSAAEESTAWPGVSRPTYLGGLRFGVKWNMGWMHDTLDY